MIEKAAEKAIKEVGEYGAICIMPLLHGHMANAERNILLMNHESAKEELMIAHHLINMMLMALESQEPIWRA